MSEEEASSHPTWDGPVDAEGLPHGMGTMTYPPPPVSEDEDEKPGDTFTGQMHHGKRHGQGKYTWSSGATYEGSYVDNKKQGHGLMTYPDKSKYEGDWVGDVMEGQGTYHYASGDIYTGSFSGGKKHGTGMYCFQAHSCQFLGVWVDGSFLEGKWVHRDGTTFHGSFESSVPNEGTFFLSRKGLVQEGKYSSAVGWKGGAVAEAQPICIAQ